MSVFDKTVRIKIINLLIICLKKTIFDWLIEDEQRWQNILLSMVWCLITWSLPIYVFMSACYSTGQGWEWYGRRSTVHTHRGQFTLSDYDGHNGEWTRWMWMFEWEWQRMWMQWMRMRMSVNVMNVNKIDRECDECAWEWAWMWWMRMRMIVNVMNANEMICMKMNIEGRR